MSTSFPQFLRDQELALQTRRREKEEKQAKADQFIRQLPISINLVREEMKRLTEQQTFEARPFRWQQGTFLLLDDLVLVLRPRERGMRAEFKPHDTAEYRWLTPPQLVHVDYLLNDEGGWTEDAAGAFLKDPLSSQQVADLILRNFVIYHNDNQL